MRICWSLVDMSTRNEKTMDEVESSSKLIGLQISNVEAQNDTIVFFNDMNTVMMSPRTADLVVFLESLVLLMKKGDRPVRRYFDSYSTPFFGFQEIVFDNKPDMRQQAY